jgi:hypothetical protein
MSGSPIHSTHSQISPLTLSPQAPSKTQAIEISKSPRRSVLSPLLYSRSRRAILHQDSHPRLNSEDSEPHSILMNDWIRMKIDVPKILYANMLASLFTWLLLASFIVLPATFASIRNSRALDGDPKRPFVMDCRDMLCLWSIWFAIALVGAKSQLYLARRSYFLVSIFSCLYH